MWVRTHEPDVWARVRHVLLPKDYVRLRLSGEYATDVADASGTLLLDVARRRWSRRDGRRHRASTATVLPDVFESPDVCARVSRDAAAATGLVAGTPIVAGAGDQAAGAVGMGITRPGAVSVTIGTSGVVFAATERPALDPEGAHSHVLSRRPGPMARHGRHAGGRAVAALDARSDRRDRRTRRRTPDAAYERLVGEASRVPPGSDGVLWAPYLMGERTPHCDPDVRAALRRARRRAHARARRFARCWKAWRSACAIRSAIFAELGVPVVNVRVGGGGARSAVWRQIQADTYGRPVETVAGGGRRRIRRRDPRRRRRRPVAHRRRGVRRGRPAPPAARSPTHAPSPIMSARYDAVHAHLSGASRHLSILNRHVRSSR